MMIETLAAWRFEIIYITRNGNERVANVREDGYIIRDTVKEIKIRPLRISNSNDKSVLTRLTVNMIGCFSREVLTTEEIAMTSTMLAVTSALPYVSTASTSGKTYFIFSIDVLIMLDEIIIMFLLK
jgi:hypothetical protein